MSGFAGILNLDGAPADARLLQRMTDSMAYRGPDGSGTWRDGAVGLGHARLDALDEAPPKPQPFTLEDRLWIAADARIDSRAELIGKLQEKGHTGCGASSFARGAGADAQLILRAYDAWGAGCVDHLLGDFSFAIWDVSRRELFCARDHFGVKPFYYAQLGRTLIFGNSLNALRLHPDFSGALCERAIGDYLLMGANLHSNLTFFEQILRLPAAHTLTVSEGSVRVSRYWSFPIEEPLRYQRPAQYLEEFDHLLGAAVRDRLRTPCATVSLSGGLDSPTVAAVAAGQLGPANLLGLTCGFRRVCPDPEPPLARAVAGYLGMPFHFTAIDDFKPYEGIDLAALELPRPCSLIAAASTADFNRRVARQGRVLLTGEGGDPGLAPSLEYYRGWGVLDLLWGVGKYLLAHRHHPRIGFRVSWQRWRGHAHGQIQNFPEWVEPAFADRAGLRERWETFAQQAPSPHPYRPHAYSSLIGPHWEHFLEEYDAETTRVPVEVRHPLLDLRLQRFFLRLPVLPWCADKELFRAGMVHRLPEQILGRPKSPVQGHPTSDFLREGSLAALQGSLVAPELIEYVRVTEELSACMLAEAPPQDLDACLRPLHLNYWLRSLHALPVNSYTS